MSTAAFVVACPCCQAKLTVDPELGAVIAHEAPPAKRTVDDLGAAFDALRSKSAEREARFREQMQAEGQKGKLLDRKFQESLKKAKDSPDPPKWPFDYECTLPAAAIVMMVAVASTDRNGHQQASADRHADRAGQQQRHHQGAKCTVSSHVVHLLPCPTKRPAGVFLGHGGWRQPPGRGRVRRGFRQEDGEP